MDFEHSFKRIGKFLFILTLLLMLVCNVARTQLPTLEFLDHSDVETILTGAVKYGDEIVYTALNTRPGWTYVRVVNSDGQVFDILDEPLPFNSEAYYHHEVNGSLRILLYKLVSGDWGNHSTDLYEIIYNGESSSVQKLSGIEPDISPAKVTSVVVDSENHRYALANNWLYRVGENVAEEIVPLSSDGMLLTNKSGEMFYIDHWEETLYAIQGSDLIEKITIPNDFSGHKVIGDHNFIVYPNRIEVYDSGFNTLIREFIPPVMLSDANQILEEGPGFLILSSEEGTIDLIKVDEDYQVESLFSADEDLGVSNNLLYFSGDYLITAGRFVFSNISDHLFFRKFPLEDDFDPERISISLADFLFSYERDTIVAGAPPLSVYMAKYSMTSEDGFDRDLTSVYSSRYLSSLSNSASYRQQHYQIFQSGSEIDFQRQLMTPYSFSDPLYAGIPGADYKFNISNMAATVIEVISNVSETWEDQTIEVFPNPVKTNLYLGSGKIPEEISFYDLLGRRIYHDPAPASASVDVSKLPTGTYIIRIIEDGKAITGKVVKK
nr:T9SS type A sorting domain-containing protein [Saprospiraceae bacterium]